MIGDYLSVRDGDRFEINGDTWTVTDVEHPEDGEPYCFLEHESSGRLRQYTEQFLNYGSGITLLDREYADPNPPSQ